MGRAVITDDRLELDAEIVAEKRGITKELAKMVLETVLEERQNHRRQPKPPAPEGGISIRAASRQYEIPHPTLSRWVKKGYIPILLRTKNELYISEDKVVELVSRYKLAPGQGKYTLKKLSHTNNT